MLKGKNILICVSGGIAAYKAVDVVSRLRKLEANVDVIMTKSACEFVTPLTFQTLSSNLVLTDTFQGVKYWEVEHIAVAAKADLCVIVPATANIIGKIANGIADDMLSTTVMAVKSDVLIAPAMNTNMYENPIVQDNISKLKRFGYKFIEPAEGRLACGDIGKGKLPDSDKIVEHIQYWLQEKPLKGKKVLVTAGPTRENIDPVRYISNYSSGKMGYSIAKCFAEKGADVTLISGPSNEICSDFVKVIDINSADEMFAEVKESYEPCDIMIMSAAVADYKAKNPSQKKIKKVDGGINAVELTENVDILKYLGEHKGDRLLVGFAAETDNLYENAVGKIKRKNLDIIVANDVTQEGAGFNVDTNIVKIIDAKGNMKDIPKCSKDEIAEHIFETIRDY